MSDWLTLICFVEIKHICDKKTTKDQSVFGGSFIIEILRSNFLVAQARYHRGLVMVTGSAGVTSRRNAADDEDAAGSAEKDGGRRESYL